MRFYDSLGALLRGNRRASAGSTTTSQSEVEDPARLTQIITDLRQRVRDLESQTLEEPTEYEIITANPSTHILEHRYKGPVRWYVVSWRCASAATWILREDTTNVFPGRLVLTSGVAGKAVVRVEPSSFTQRPGLT